MSQLYCCSCSCYAQMAFSKSGQATLHTIKSVLLKPAMHYRIVVSSNARYLIENQLFVNRSQNPLYRQPDVLNHVKLMNVIKRDEFELQFSGSSEPQLWRFWAEPSWGTSIFELKPSWNFFKNYTQISKFSTSIMIITNANQLHDNFYEFI